MAINKKMKFKIGDKVKILQSAIVIGVAEEEIGKIGVILRIDRGADEILVETTTIRYSPWYVGENDIAPAIKVGQQLLFNFME